MTDVGTGKPLRILCVDDNELVSSALEVRLGREAGLAWLGWARDGASAVTQITELLPDIVLMDLDMPGTDSFGVIAKLAERCPEVLVIVLSGHVNIHDIDRALDLGAWGYISKSDDAEILVEGIRKVARGQIALGREVEAVQRRRRGSTAAPR